MDLFGFKNISGYMPAENFSNITVLQRGRPVIMMNLSDLLGPKRRSLTEVIPITVVYSIIFISGIVGNLATCVVIKVNPYMHTATNYYLFNLAVADLLVLLFGLPLELYKFWSAYPWIFGEVFCVWRSVMAESCTNASVLTITAFTVERYIAICHPMVTKTMSSFSRVIKINVIIWIISFSSSVPISIQFGVTYLPDRQGNSIPDSATCTIKQEQENKTAFEISTFLFFCTPMTVISVLYGLIGMKLIQTTSRKPSTAMSNGFNHKVTDRRGQQLMRSRRTAIKMLVAVVIAFFVCWAPFHAQRLMTIYVVIWNQKLKAIEAILYYISGVLYYISSTINPILYHIMSLKYRQALKDTIGKVCRRKKRQTTYSSLQLRNRSSYISWNSNCQQHSTRPSLRVYEIGGGRIRTAVTIEPSASSSISARHDSGDKLS